MDFRKRAHEWDGIEPWFWPAVAREFPPPKPTPFRKRDRKGGRPRVSDRLALNAILWRLRCGGTWKNLPALFGSAVTARRRLDRWLRNGRLERAWRAYLSQLSLLDLRRWRDCLAVGSARGTVFWRFGLELIWKREFEPFL